MGKKRGAPSRREDILHAALHVVNELGAAQLTLDATAATAGVSKGGLLYHFPSKESLIEALLDAYLEGFDARVDALLAADDSGQTAGRYLRAYVNASFDDPLPDSAFSSAALAIVTAHPEMKDKVASRYQRWQQRILADGLATERALTIMLATDGVWATDVLGLHVLNDDQRDAMRNYLIAQIEQAAV